MSVCDGDITTFPEGNSTADKLIKYIRVVGRPKCIRNTTFNVKSLLG
jgi:hypothetical protein